ncbi:hypothetical protein X763_29535 [Mesorhizobium sp. LSHC432A00]|nr:hypothetical protein X763_29535 [Mesorhizobium sp. LSHC432A00]
MDGILDLDLVASQPMGLVLEVITTIGVAKAFPVPAWVVGVRVHSSTNEIEAKIEGASVPTKASMSGEGLPVPWPFPWWVPKSVRR